VTDLADRAKRGRRLEWTGGTGALYIEGGEYIVEKFSSDGSTSRFRVLTAAEVSWMNTEKGVWPMFLNDGFD
jgi:hypothetical protein